jgi:hypothetical protein
MDTKRMTLVLAMLMLATPGKTADACEGPFARQGVLSDVRPGLPNREAVRVIGVVTGYGSVNRAVGKRMDVHRAATLRIRVREVVSGRIANGDLDVVTLGYSASCNTLGRVLWFEFDRALLGLANAPSRERFARLENLAAYPYSFRAFRQADQEFFGRLVSDSGVTAAEARRLLDRFDRHSAGQGALRSSAPPETPVRTMLGIKVPGKVEGVHWSEQSDASYIQISFPGAPTGQKQPPLAKTQVWLLKADGTVVTQKSKSPDSPAMSISNAGWDTQFVIYDFPPRAQSETGAVVVKVDDEFFVERPTGGSVAATSVPATSGLPVIVPGKVDRVFWTCGRDCTVQIAFPGHEDGRDEPRRPTTQVWMLNADGTTIPQVGKPDDITVGGGGGKVPSTTYSFPLTARTDAIRIVVRIDEQFFVVKVPGTTAPQEADKRSLAVVTRASVPGVYSVYAELTDDLPGTAAVSARVRAYRLSDSLYVRIIPQSHVAVERGVPAYAIQLSRDAAGQSVILPTNQPRHGSAADYLRAADFRNGDNTGPNETGPKNVNAAGEFREVQFADYGLEIRVLSFEIVGLGPSKVPAFTRVSCLVTIKARGR